MDKNETILQFGAGNFVRAFADTFFDEMNAGGQNVGKVVIVQSTGDDRARLLNDQAGQFHVIVRGLDKGVAVDRTQIVASVSRALVARNDWEAIVAIACSPALRAVVSNTTEAGFALDAADDDAPSREGAPASFPAKLLTLLRARFEAGEGGLTILPCELIAPNGDTLHRLIAEQAHRWGWEERGFLAFLNHDCAWVNTLVDRIVSGVPADHPLLATDALLTVTEPYAFWAVEDRPATAWLTHPAIHRVADVQPYALRKVRILNGAHTALVAYVRQTGRTDTITLVRQAIADPEIAAWLRGLLFEEIVPTIEDRVADAHAYAEQTLERFANPYLDHQLSAIALHHDTKVGIRLIPTRDEFRAKFGREPERLNSVLDGGT